MQQPNTPASSDRRAAASRANGALSRGPITATGKARSSQNARTHGFTAAYTPTPTAADVLTHLESASNFQTHATRYFDYFQPTNAVEYDLVERLVVSKWQIDRIIVARAAAISLEAIDTAHEVKKKYDAIAPDGQLALAIKSLDEKSNILTNLSRYESRHVRDYDKALQLLNYNPEPMPPMPPDLSLDSNPDSTNDEESENTPPPQDPTEHNDSFHPNPLEQTPNTEPEPRPAQEPNPQPHTPLLFSLFLALQFLCLFLTRTATHTFELLNPAPCLAALSQIQLSIAQPNFRIRRTPPIATCTSPLSGWPPVPLLNRG